MSFSFNPAYNTARSTETPFGNGFQQFETSEFRSRVNEMIQSVRSKSPPKRTSFHSFSKVGIQSSNPRPSSAFLLKSSQTLGLSEKHPAFVNEPSPVNIDPALVHDSVVQDLHVKLHHQIDLNVKLNAEKTELELLVNEERRKYEELRSRYESKLEQEVSLREEMERRVSHLSDELSLKHHENNELQQRLAQAESHINSKELEIKRLREELRRLGEMTNLKIKEMEEKLNHALRAQHSIEQSFINERDALVREHEANLKSVIHECELRIRQQEEQVRAKTADCTRYENEIIRIRDGVQRMAIEQEEKLRATSLKIKEEEAHKFRQMVQEMEARLLKVNEAKDFLAKKINELMRESEANEKLNQEKILHLETELHNYKNEWNSLQGEMINIRGIAQRLKQENDQKEQEVIRLRSENGELRSNLNREEEAHRQELNRLHIEFNNAKREWESAGELLKRRIIELENTGRQYEAELNRLNGEYKRLVEMLQNNLNQTITSVITEYKGSNGIRGGLSSNGGNQGLGGGFPQSMFN